jgi:hypothetical protein
VEFSDLFADTYVSMLGLRSYVGVGNWMGSTGGHLKHLQPAGEMHQQLLAFAAAHSHPMQRHAQEHGSLTSSLLI